MKINQVYALVNSVVKQMTGETPIEVTNLSGLISLGDYVLNSGTANSKDDFLNVLVDRIGRSVFTSRPYTPETTSLLNEAFEFGAILQKVYIAPSEAETSKTWGLKDGDSIDQYVVKKPVVKQSLFSNMDVWQITITIPDVQLKSAFTSAEAMASFIDGIFVMLSNSMAMEVEAMAKMCMTNFIAEKIKAGNGVINLLTDYNNGKATPITAGDAITDKDFLRYAARVINQTIKNMSKMSTVFNNSGYWRHTSSEYCRVMILDQFAAATTTYLESDTYHNELVALPEYHEVSYWQGSGTEFAFEDVSAVNVVPSSGGDAINQTGIVALISDVEAYGIMFDNRRTTSAWNANGEYTNYFEKADKGYFNDLSENGVVFIVADTSQP